MTLLELERLAAFAYVGLPDPASPGTLFWVRREPRAAVVDELRRLFDDPTMLLVEWDAAADLAFFLPLRRESYSQCSFLDRARTAPFARERHVLYGVRRSALLDRYAAYAPTSPPVHYIFHTGHCGSTLLSRAVDIVADCLPLREPPILAFVAWAARDRFSRARPDYAAQFALATELLARRFTATETPVVKAPSWTGNLMGPLLSGHPESRAVFLYQDLASHLVALWPYSDSDLIKSARNAAADIEDRLGESVDAAGLNHAQRAAVSWLGWLLLARQAERRAAERLRWVRCADLMRESPRIVAEVRVHLGLGMREHEGALADVFRHYSKDPQRRYWAGDYDTKQRAGRQALAREIGEATAFAESLMNRHAPLAELSPYLADSDRPW